MKMMGKQSIDSTFIPLKIIENYDLIAKNTNKNNWVSISETDVWNELCFCIFSANVNYDLAKSTLNHLIKNNFLDPLYLNSKHDSMITLKNELSKSIYFPKKKDGTLRKYRYPEKRAKQIVENAEFIYQKNNGLKNMLSCFENPVKAREHLIQNIHGIGIKEASHFLRNIGYCDSLAIIDVHVLAFLTKLSLIQTNHHSTLTTKLYLHIEKILRNFAKFHNKILSILDIAIWHYMRNSIV